MSEFETWVWRIGGFVLGCLLWRFFGHVARIATALESHPPAGGQE